MNPIVKPKRVVEIEKAVPAPTTKAPDWWRTCSDDEFKARVSAMVSDEKHELAAVMKAAVEDIGLQLQDPESDSRAWAHAARLAQRKIAARRTVLGGLMASFAEGRRRARLLFVEKRRTLLQEARGHLEANLHAESLRCLIEAMETWDANTRENEADEAAK